MPKNIISVPEKATLKCVNSQIDYSKGKVYLFLDYTLESETAVYLITFPKIVLPIDMHHIPCVEFLDPDDLRSGNECNIVFSEFSDIIYTSEADNHEYYKMIKIKDKPKKMTKKEIEKALGYSVEIISEEEKRNDKS